MSRLGPIVVSFFTSMLLCSASMGAETDVSEAQYIVAETNDEIIHYATFCGFFELRTLLHNALNESSQPSNAMGEQTLTFHLIGKNGISKIAIGAEWISIDGDVTALDHESYLSILALVQNRVGRGAPKKNIDDKIASIHEKVLRLDPEYRAENRCSSHDGSAP